MRLDATAPLLIGVAAVMVSAVFLATVWDRVGFVVRAGIAVCCVLSVAATSALELNGLTETYPTWSALAGSGHDDAGSGHDGAGSGHDAVGGHLDAAGGHHGAAGGHHGAAGGHHGAAAAAPRQPGALFGTITAITITGRFAGMTMPAFVYLPGAYDTLAGRAQRFPVIEATHGYPGSPKTWLRRLNVRIYLDKEIAAGRMAPTVVVFPYQTPRPLLDTECTDLVGGAQAETYLTKDVPAAIKSRFRVRTDRAGWGLIGYSAGGFCSTNLALRHPGEYAAAASLSGYAEAGISIGDGSENTTNNPAWRLQHLPRPDIGLYIAYANDDRHARRDDLLLAHLARSPMSVTTAVVAHGGHSDAVWEEMEGPAFDWLSSWLARPTSWLARPTSLPDGQATP